MHITDLSFKKPVTIFMVFVSLLVIGTIATRLIPIEFMPDITFPGAFIQIPYSNSTPRETEERIIRPIEEVLATLSGVQQLNSNSGESDGNVVVLFKQGTDINLKAIEIKEKIESIRGELPEDFRFYQIFKFADGAGPNLNLRISSDRDLSDAFELLNRNLKQRLERIDGVGQVNLYGVEKKEIRVELIPERINAYKLDINEIAAALRSANFSLSAGKITDADTRFTVRPVGELSTVEEIQELKIAGKNIKIKDIATVAYITPMREYARHLDRKYAVGLDITKESDANTVQVVKDVLAEIEEINKLKEMEGISIYQMFNQAEGILSSLKELLNSGMIGGVFSILVLFFFLRHIATTLIVALAVPFSLIVTLGIFYFMGITLNILSMMGLMLAIGMLVDNAVVVTENIHRYKKLIPDSKQAAILGTKEVAIAVTAGTLTSVIVFLPNIVNPSLISQHMYYIGMGIIISLLASLLISLTVIPLLASRFSLSISEKTTIVDRIADKYSSLLSWLINRRVLGVFLILGIIASAVLPFQFTNVDMFPRVEERQLYLQYNLNSAYTLETVKKAVDEVEDYLYNNQEEFEIESVYTWYTTEFAQSTINLISDKNAKKAVPLLKEEIANDLPVIAIGEPSFEFVNRNGGERLRVFISGESMQELESLADEAARRLNQVDSFLDVRSESESGSEELRLTLDRTRAANFGVSATSVANLVSNAVRGQTVQRVKGKDGEIDVVLALQNSDRQTPEDIQKIPVVLASGETVPLSGLMEMELGKSSRRIFRENRKTSLGITANLANGVVLDEAKVEMERVMNEIQLPAGYSWSFGRNFSNDSEAMNAMLFNIFIALFLIYLVMASIFESILYPSGIITCVLFGVVGIFWFFFITGTTFDLMALIGILILMGIVVNNGIVLIDHINHLRGQGHSRNEAITMAGKDRMRPILMTAFTTILGLIPLSIGNTQIGGDGPAYFPMARAILGGLTFSTFITLLILPTIYVLQDDTKTWFSKVFKRASSVAAK